MTGFTGRMILNSGGDTGLFQRLQEARRVLGGDLDE